MSAARDEPPVLLRRLSGGPAGRLSADELVAGLALAELADPRRPYVVLNMVQTADGRATIAGRTAPLSSVADRQLFHALRTRVDAIMVGAGTVRLERYGRLVRDPRRREQRVAAGLAPEPLAIVVSASLDLAADVPLLQAAAQRIVVITASDAEIAGAAARIDYVRCEPGELPRALAAVRRDHAVRSILCEGGPRLNASLLTAGLVDELFLTTVPLIAGAGGALEIAGAAALAEPAALELRWLLEHDGELFARYGVRR